MTDGGVLFGAGLGSEFKMDEGNSLLISAEWSRNLTEKFGMDLDFDDFSALIGWSTSF